MILRWARLVTQKNIENPFTLPGFLHLVSILYIYNIYIFGGGQKLQKASLAWNTRLQHVQGSTTWPTGTPLVSWTVTIGRLKQQPCPAHRRCNWVFKTDIPQTKNCLGFWWYGIYRSTRRPLNGPMSFRTCRQGASGSPSLLQFKGRIAGVPFITKFMQKRRIKHDQTRSVLHGSKFELPQNWVV